jgi:ATP-dependent exoDNAse (exonuclease V) beta subunit
MSKPVPPDQLERGHALDPMHSVLVQAPAGSGKTTLLTERFLTLLAEVDEPAQIVAITFTNAAAAEMRNRILDQLSKSESYPLAQRVLERSNKLGWNLLELPAQLRITTIDAFCRELALQQPLLSGLGGALDIAEQPADLYRRAARATLRQIDAGNRNLSNSIAALLQWHDNDWHSLEEMLVEMLSKRDRWMQGFVLDREPDTTALREQLERPFARAVNEALTKLTSLLDLLLNVRQEALKLARFACSFDEGRKLFQELAELAEFPSSPFNTADEIEAARQAHLHLAKLLLTDAGEFRKQVNVRIGFPADHKREKAQLLALIEQARSINELESSLASIRVLPPACYTEDDWQIIRACFTLLRHAAGELRIAFAESGTVDYTEVAQIALQVLRTPDGEPTDAALAIAGDIRHLLVDEFQDTSRRQHQLLSSLIAAWPERTGRTCFMVGDPMQSIYFFRDADTELFSRVRDLGLEISDAEPFLPDSIALRANFRTEPALVDELNGIFEKVFATDDHSGITFSSAEPARASDSIAQPRFNLHLEFVPQTSPGKAADPLIVEEIGSTRAAQIAQIITLIQSQQSPINDAISARARGEEKKYRVAVLARAKSHLVPIAEALRKANIDAENQGKMKIPVRAVELENLSARPEVQDVLSLARALLNPLDRVAWLGILRAPWCGLSLADLHTLVGADDAELLAQPVPELLRQRQHLLSEDGRTATARVLQALSQSPSLRATQPTATLGTWLEQIWLHLGGNACVDQTGRANLNALWSFLDQLPSGEESLLSPGFDAALNQLTAQPDPDTSSDCGVQLMTIHKSKGLEFEVVIVPELQAGGGRSGSDLLSWLERGLAQPDESGAITEFLVAPRQSKGADRGIAKAWVDRIYRERETQEMRRVLYVAATRAREELHFFARPAYSSNADNELILAEPENTLLATAWPAFESEVRAHFERFKTDRHGTASETEIASIAAASESNLIQMPSPCATEPKPTLLLRLPHNAPSITRTGPPDLDFETGEMGAPGPGSPRIGLDPWGGDPSHLGTRESEVLNITQTGQSTLYQRHEGGAHSRALGTAVHTLLEELSKLRAVNDWPAARLALQQITPRIVANIRAAGIPLSQANAIAAKALEITLQSSHDPTGQWILSPRADAASELRIAGLVSGSLRTIQVDRLFRAGLAPRDEGEDAWWIIDYKTAHSDQLDPASALPQLRSLFAPQLQIYAVILRNLRGKDAILRAGLFYPRLLAFDWWAI